MSKAVTKRYMVKKSILNIKEGRESIMTKPRQSRNPNLTENYRKDMIRNIRTRKEKFDSNSQSYSHPVSKTVRQISPKTNSQNLKIYKSTNRLSVTFRSSQFFPNFGLKTKRRMTNRIR